MGNPLHIYFILDGSGSMSGVQDDVIGGLQQFIKDQKELEGIDGDETFFSLTVFDTNVYQAYAGTPIEDVDPDDITRATTLKGGGTALLDAVGKTLNEVENANLAGRKLVVIYTDGQENSSREYKNAAVKSMLKRLEDSGDWTITFMSAGVDNWSQAEALGIAHGNYAAAGAGATLDNFQRISSTSSQLRSSGRKSTASFYRADIDPGDEHDEDES